MKRFHVLYNLITENKFKTFVEVGVAAGTTSKFLLDHIPDLKIYCVDPYEVYEGYEGSHRSTPEELMKKHDYASKTLFSNPRVTFYKKHSLDAVKSFSPESIDIVFIDGNHFYKWVKEDIEAWYPIVKAGGVLAGHDFIRRNNWGVRSAVREFAKAKGLDLKVSKDTTWFVYKPPKS